MKTRVTARAERLPDGDGGRDLRSRPPLGRMLELHRELRAGRFPNCRKVAAQLEVSAKTIQRDIDFMRDRLGLPIEYDQLHFGFFYSRPVESFPTFEVTEGELVALLVAQKAVAQYRGTPFERPLGSAFRKLAANLRDRIQFDWGGVDAAISFRGLGPSVADLDLFETVSKAVLGSRELAFAYHKLGAARHEERRVQPYHLACIENAWYLFGHDAVRGQLRTFALARMKNVRDLNTKFRRPADFSVDRLLGGSFGVFRGTGRHRVQLRCDAFAARLIGERRWHDSQQFKRLADGGLEVAFTLDSLVEIERWVLGWGDHVKVLGPAALARRIAAAAARIAAAYRA